MAIFDEPSKGPLPQPGAKDVAHSIAKGVVSEIPMIGGPVSELLGLLISPIAERRDGWLTDLQRRLHELEAQKEGFCFSDLSKNERFVSAVLQATTAAARTHKKEKREALRNAVLNVATGDGLSEDVEALFLNFIDSFTTVHLKVLGLFAGRDPTIRAQLATARDLTDPVVLDLASHGLVIDPRPYVARGRESSNALVVDSWKLSRFGEQFVWFISIPLG